MSIEPATRTASTIFDFLKSPKGARDVVVNTIIEQVFEQAHYENDSQPILKWTISSEAHREGIRQISVPSFLILHESWEILLNLIAGKYFPDLSTHSIFFTLDGRLLNDLRADHFDEEPGASEDLTALARSLEAEEKGEALEGFIVQDTKLRTLKIIHLPLPKEQLLRTFPALGQHPSLKKLDLSGNQLENNEAHQLLNALSNRTNPISLNLSQNQISSTKEISPIILLGPFDTINLSNNPLTAKGICPLLEMLANFPDEPTLSSLKLNNATLDTESVPLICNALKNSTSLKKLFLNGNQFDNEDVFHIVSAALDSTSLDELQIKNNPINDEGFEKIKELLKNRPDNIVKSISIDSMQIIDPTNKSFIAQVLEAPYLELEALGWTMGHLVTTIWDRMQQQYKLNLGPLSQHHNSLNLTRQSQNGVIHRVLERFRRQSPLAIEQGPPPDEDEPFHEFDLD